jgi:glucose/arabinose dehydrogenase
MTATNHPMVLTCTALACTVLLGACSESTRLPDKADVGARPTLVAPVKTLLPTVHIAPASPWPEGKMPQAAAGMQVAPFATGLDHPRWLLVLPNGDVLVAETNAPPKPDDGKGIKGWVMKKVMARAGAGVPSANRITLIRDADGDGRPESRSVFLEGLNSPFGMAIVGDKLYVANTDAVMEYAYSAGATRIDGPGRKLTDLPAGTINHHWTKSLMASPDGSKLYATVGSNSNVGENGMAAEEGRAAIWEIDRASGSKRLYATGLRNPNGMAWMPSAAGDVASVAGSAGAASAAATAGAVNAAPVLWTVANERDEIGSDLVPDYLTSVRDGAFYGWPYSWYGQHVDERVQPPNAALVAKAVPPDYALGAHVAALGLAAKGSEGVYIGLHGSWNRRPHSGYKVVYVPFAAGKPSGPPADVLTGFLSPDGKAWGRPVGVAMDSRGALLVADDVGNTVWRVTQTGR